LPIREALTEARMDRFKPMLRALTNGRCHPQYLEFLTASGWVSTRINCVNPFFLDYMPRPQ
jgi:hypothetical protein